MGHPVAGIDSAVNFNVDYRKHGVLDLCTPAIAATKLGMAASEG
jgi:hypothetical protein